MNDMGKPSPPPAGVGARLRPAAFVVFLTETHYGGGVRGAGVRQPFR